MEPPMHEIAPSTRSEANDKISTNHIVITVHGIRTYGEWQNRLQTLLRSADPSIDVRTYVYGYFTSAAFLIPFLRRIVVRRFTNSLRQIIQDNPTARIDVLAHSFGTHIVGWSLVELQNVARLHTVILAGSVLRAEFDWAPLLQRKTVARVVNDCGNNDFVLFISRLFVLFTGHAGRIGFIGMMSNSFQNRYFRGGHSHYFQGSVDNNNAFMLRYWVPLFTTEGNIERIDQRIPLRWWESVLDAIARNAEPIKLTIYLFLFSLPAVYYYVMTGRVTEQRNLAMSRQGELLVEGARTATATGKNAFAASLLDEFNTLPKEVTKNVAYMSRLLGTELSRRTLRLVRVFNAASLSHQCLDVSPNANWVHVVESDINGRLTSYLVPARLPTVDIDSLVTPEAQIGIDRCSGLGRRFSLDGSRFIQLGQSIKLIDTRTKDVLSDFEETEGFLDAGFGLSDQVILVVHVNRVVAIDIASSNVVGTFNHSIDDLWSTQGRLHILSRGIEWTCDETLNRCTVLPADEGNGALSHVLSQTVIQEEQQDEEDEDFCRPPGPSTSMIPLLANGLLLTQESDGPTIRGARTGNFLGTYIADRAAGTFLRRKGTGELLAVYSLRCGPGTVTAQMYAPPPSPIEIDEVVLAFGIDVTGTPIAIDSSGTIRTGFELESRGHVEFGAAPPLALAVARVGDRIAISTLTELTIRSLADGSLKCKALLADLDTGLFDEIALSVHPTRELILVRRFGVDGGSSDIFDSTNCRHVASEGMPSYWSPDGSNLLGNETTAQLGTGFIYVTRWRWKFDPASDRTSAISENDAASDKSANEQPIFSVHHQDLGWQIPLGGLIVLPQGTDIDKDDTTGGEDSRTTVEATAIDADSGHFVCRVPNETTGAWRLEDRLIALAQGSAVTLVDEACRFLSSLETNDHDVVWVGADTATERIMTLDVGKRLQVLRLQP